MVQLNDKSEGENSIKKWAKKIAKETTRSGAWSAQRYWSNAKTGKALLTKSVIFAEREFRGTLLVIFAEQKKLWFSKNVILGEQLVIFAEQNVIFGEQNVIFGEQKNRYSTKNKIKNSKIEQIL